MERTKYNLNLPDAIYSGHIKQEYTQIPNELLKDSTLSAKAKIILCILLSNQKGWKSYVTVLQTYLKEGKESIDNGLRELEQHGYLLRCIVRIEKTKVRIGSFWAYTDIPLRFDIRAQIIELCDKNLETLIKCPQLGLPDMGFPELAFPYLANPQLIILNNNNINNKNTNITTSSDEEEFKTPVIQKTKLPKDYFEKFWQLYPKKTDKGKALKAWNAVCTRSKKEKVDWKIIKKAILSQMKSERWQDPNFIPMPTTWLNQNRWLDDPNEMKNFTRKGDKPNITGHRDKNYKYRQPDMEV